MPHWIATEPDVACRVQKNACRLAALGYKCSLNHVPFHLPVTWLLAAVVPWALPARLDAWRQDKSCIGLPKKLLADQTLTQRARN